MSYLADPGGVFDTDVHRRVLGHLPLPGDDPIAVYDDTGSERQQRRYSLFHRLGPDEHTPIDDQDALDEVLSDLEASGYAKQTANGWKMTKAGLDALNAPVPEGADNG